MSFSREALSEGNTAEDAAGAAKGTSPSSSPKRATGDGSKGGGLTGRHSYNRSLSGASDGGGLGSRPSLSRTLSGGSTRDKSPGKQSATLSRLMTTRKNLLSSE